MWLFVHIERRWSMYKVRAFLIQPNANTFFGDNVNSLIKEPFGVIQIGITVAHGAQKAQKGLLSINVGPMGPLAVASFAR